MTKFPKISDFPCIYKKKVVFLHKLLTTRRFYGAQYDCIGNPYNESPKHRIGIAPHTAPDELLRDLTRNSYEIVKAKYNKKK